MMMDNVFPLPGRVERLVKAIQIDLQRQAKGERDWIEASCDLCLHLAELRDAYKSNIEFGRACEANGFGGSVLNEHDRAASIAMGREPEAMRACLEASKRRSLRLIYEQEFGRFGTAAKTKRPRAEKRPVGKKESHSLDVFDEMQADGLTINKRTLAERAGVSHGTAARAIFKREAEAEVRPVEPLELETAPASVRERMEAWQRAETKRLRAVIHAELKIEYDFSGDLWVCQVWERAAWAEKIIASARGVMSKADYQTIVKCLHPDTSPDPLLKAEAFRLFTQHKDVLLKPELTFSGPPLPTLGELLARRRNGK